jgi:hypothetical protein
MNKEVAEVLLECAEALDEAPVDAQHRDQHYARISDLVTTAKLQPRVIELLRSIESRMRALASLNVLDMVVSDRGPDRAVAVELRSLVSSERSYVYHGTVFGRLASIAKDGLVPAMKPVWTNREHIRDHCRQAVFFTTTWRGAAQWADMAHRRARGRRDSLVRRPVVIRLPAGELTIERDPLAMAPGCLLVHGEVATANADVFVGPLAGFPRWQPLASMSRAP